jgi:hypothetical protein
LQCFSFEFYRFLDNGDLTGYIDAIEIDKILQLLKHLDKRAVVGVGRRLGSSKKVARLYGLQGMFLSEEYKFIDKLFFIDL